MRVILITILFVTGAVLSVNSVVMASALFFWNDVFRPLDFARHTGAYPASLLIFILLIFSYGKSFLQGRFRLHTGWYFYVSVLLLVWLAACCIMSPFPEVVWAEYIVWLKYLLPILVIYTAINRVSEIKFLMLVLCLSLGVWSAHAGIYCMFKGVCPDIGIPNSQLWDRNDFAAAVVGTIPVFVFFTRHYSSILVKWVRRGFVILLLLSFIAVVLSLSRGASLGMGMMLLAYIAFGSRKKMRDFAILAVVGTTIFLSLPESWFERMSSIEFSAEQTEGSARNRLELMKGAFQATLDRPVFGWGPGGWLEVCLVYGPSEHNPHSIWLVVSSETGFVGLGIFLLLLWITFYRLRRAQIFAESRGDIETCRMATALFTCIAGLLACMTFLNRPYNEYLLAWMCLANALSHAIAGKEEEGEPEDSPNLVGGQ